MSDDEQPAGDKPDDEALHEQSRAQLERLKHDPKTQQLLADLEAERGPDDDPAFWDGAQARPPAPPSELALHHAGVKPVTVAKPEPGSEPADKVLLSAEARAAEVIAELAAEAGMAPEEFQKLPRGDPALQTVVSARRVAEAERTVAGTARLEKTPEIEAQLSEEQAQRIREDGFDPTEKTVGGRTERGLPVPGELGADEGREEADAGAAGDDEASPAEPPAEAEEPPPADEVSDPPPARPKRAVADEPSPLPPATRATADDPSPSAASDPETSKQQRALLLLLAFVAIVVIGLVWLVLRVPPRIGVGVDAGPGAKPATTAGGASAAGSATGQPEPSAPATGPGPPNSSTAADPSAPSAATVPTPPTPGTTPLPTTKPPPVTSGGLYPPDI